QPARLSCAEAFLLLGEPARAVTVMEEGLTQKNVDSYRPWLARAHVAWVDAAGKDSPEDKEKRLVLIDRGLKYNPNDLELLKRLVEVSRGTGPEKDRARALMETLLAQGKCAGMLHLLLGMHAFDQGKLDEAKLHLSQAYKLSPNVPVVANNLAWVLAHSEPPELDRALELINTVLEQDPRNLAFRETRGQIYVKLGKWRDA